MKLIKKRNDVFLRFLISYIAILIIPLLIGMFAYQKAFTVVEEEEKNNALTSLETAKSITDSYTASIERLVYQISSDRELNSILTEKSVSNYSMKLFLDGLKSYFSANDKYSRHYIYLKNSNYIVTPETVFQKDFFFKSIFKYGNNNSDQIQEKLSNEYIKGEYWPESSAIHEGGNQKVIAYVHSIPLNYTKQSDGVIISLIDTSKFKELLSNINTSEGSWGYIADNDNNILTSVHADNQVVKAIEFSGTQGFYEFNEANEKMLAAYTTSTTNGWKYVAVIPSKVIMQKVNGIRAMTITVMLIALLMGIIIAFLLSSKNVRPIKNIAAMFAESTGNNSDLAGNDLDIIKGNISSLMQSNNHLKSVLNEQASLVKTAFFDRLLKGEFINKEDINAMTLYMGLDLKLKKHIVVLISLYNNNDLINEEIINEINISKIIVKDTIAKKLSENVLINEYNVSKLALLITAKSSDADYTRKSIEKSFMEIYNQVEEKCHLKLHIAFGEAFDDLSYTNQSYEEASRALEYSLNSTDKYIVWFNEIPKHSDGFYFPIEQETRLMNIVKSGNFSEVKLILDSNYTDNFVNRTLSPEMADSLLLSLWLTAVKLNIQLQLDCIPANGVRYFSKIKSYEKGYAYISNAFEKMCDIIKEQKQYKNKTLKNNILDYIDSEFTDPNISLSSIASRFGFTEAYVSYFFKEHTGENFISYLTDKRIQLSCELLSTTSQSVSDIAAHVGYNSDQVFRRAFKRKMDIGPAEYRNSHKS